MTAAEGKRAARWQPLLHGLGMLPAYAMIARCARGHDIGQGQATTVLVRLHMVDRDLLWLYHLQAILASPACNLE